MREATGELNITVVVVILVAAIAALFGAFVMPQMKEYVENDADCAKAICICRSTGCNDEKTNGYYEETCYTKENVNSRSNGFTCPFKG